MRDGEILYLREVDIIIKYVLFKCEKSIDLVSLSRMLIKHNEQKVYVAYKFRE